MHPRQIFENLHTVMAVLVLFEQFSGKFCLYFLPLTLNVSPNMLHFVRTVSILFAQFRFCSHSFDYACLKRLRHIVVQRLEITQKFYSSKASLKMAAGGMHSPHLPPGSAPAWGIGLL